MENAFLTDNQDFVVFGQQHLATILVAAAFGAALITWAKHHATQAQQHFWGKAISLYLCIVVIVWTFIRIALGKFDPTGDLPLAICNLMAVSMPMLMFTRKYAIYEVFYFWIFAGTVQAIITPDLHLGFPHHTYFKYWTVHLGLVICILYATIVFNMRPTWQSMLRAFMWLQLYVLLAFFANILLGSNYAYLNHKPHVASLLDYFGNWPWYIIVSELLAIPFFLLAYLPFLRQKNTTANNKI
jgi:hypothetical integral membrane protein (TIGR02206 family)